MPRGERCRRHAQLGRLGRHAKDFGRLDVEVLRTVVEVDEAAIGRPPWPVNVLSAFGLGDDLLVLSVGIGNEKRITQRPAGPDEQDSFAVRDQCRAASACVRTRRGATPSGAAITQVDVKGFCSRLCTWNAIWVPSGETSSPPM